VITYTQSRDICTYLLYIRNSQTECLGRAFQSGGFPTQSKPKGSGHLSIASDLIRGNTDMIILSHLLTTDSYGYDINKSIRNRTGDLFELKEATLYTAFRRLENSGCISSYWGDEGSGARRRYYTITELGRRTFHEMVGEWVNAKTLIDQLIKM